MEVKKRYQRPQMKTLCSNPECGKTFLKDCSEVRRNQKLGRANYCTFECSGKVNAIHLSGYCGSINNKYLEGHAGNRRDEFTGLREHLQRAKRRTKEVNITLQDLLDIWSNQNGTCPYTGIKLVQPIDGKDEHLMNKASLDRIDSSKGYVKGNVQFISATANLAKQSMTHDEMVMFCKLIAKHWE